MRNHKHGQIARRRATASNRLGRGRRALLAREWDTAEGLGLGRSAKHLILFVAASPHGHSLLRLAEECAEIQRELALTPYRDDFSFVSRWAVSIDDLMRLLTELNPTVVHFSGHGAADEGLILQDERGQPQVVSGRALAMMIAATTHRVRAMVLNACHGASQAEALLASADCVVAMDGAIGDDAARAFAVRFYGALGYRRSIGNAVAHGIAVLAARQLPDELLPRCVADAARDLDEMFLATPGE